MLRRRLGVHEEGEVGGPPPGSNVERDPCSSELISYLNHSSNQKPPSSLPLLYFSFSCFWSGLGRVRRRQHRGSPLSLIIMSQLLITLLNDVQPPLPAWPSFVHSTAEITTSSALKGPTVAHLINERPDRLSTLGTPYGRSTSTDSSLFFESHRHHLSDHHHR